MATTNLNCGVLISDDKAVDFLAGLEALKLRKKASIVGSMEEENSAQVFDPISSFMEARKTQAGNTRMSGIGAGRGFDR